MLTFPAYGENVPSLLTLMITETGMQVTGTTESGLGVLGGVLACGSCKQTLIKWLIIESNFFIKQREELSNNAAHICHISSLHSSLARTYLI